MDEKRLTKLEQVLFHEYTDGSVRCIHNRLDAVSRRTVPDLLFVTAQTDETRWTSGEILLIGAAELLSREAGLDYPLPF